MSGKLRSYKIIILLFLFSFIYITTIKAQERYWVNGSGSWNDTEHWAKVSGGEGGASVPTKSDNVIIDEHSFSGSGEAIEIKGKVSCNDFIWKETPYKSILKSKNFLFNKLTRASLNIHGSFIIKDDIQNKFYGDINLLSENTEILDVKAGLNSEIFINAEQGSYKLKRNLTNKEDVQFLQGKINVNENIFECEGFISKGNKAKEFNFDNSTVKVDSWNSEDASNLQLSQKQGKIQSKEEISSGNLLPGKVNFRNVSYIKNGAKGVSFDVDIDSTSCSYSDDGSITVTITAGTPDYNYQLYDKSPWEDDATLLEESGLISNDSYTFSGLYSGNYGVKVIDNSSASSQVDTVESPTEFTLGDITVEQTLSCYFGSDAELKANPNGGTEPYTYDWYKANESGNFITINQYTQIATNLGQGVYKVVVKDAHQCKDSLSNFINYTHPNYNIPDSITFESISSTNTCEGKTNGTISISASGGTDPIQYYLIKTSNGDKIPSSGYDADGDFSGLEPDTYETYAIDDNDCIKQGDDVTIEITPKPEAFAGNDTTICSDKTYQTVQATADEYASLQWTTPDGNGSFGDPNSLTTEYIHDASDVGKSITLTLTATGNGNCLDSSHSMILTINEQPDVSAGSNSPICEEEDIQLTESGGDAVSWAWSGPEGFSSSNQNPVINNATPNNSGTYYVTVTAANGCTNIDSVEVTVNSTPSVNAGSNSPVCEGSDINLTESGGDATSWSWSGPDGFSSTAQNPTISDATPVNAGKYYVTITDGNGCTNIDSVDVTVYSSPNVSAGSNSPICEGQDLNLTESGGDAQSWSWSGPDGFSSADQNPTISNASPSNSGWYYVTITDGNGCTNIDSVDVTVNPTPSVNAGSNSPVCEGSDINLTESGGDATGWSWSGPDGFSSTAQNPTISDATPANAGKYYVTITDGNGCTNIDSVDVTVYSSPNVSAGSNSPVCEGSDINLTESGGDATSWSWSGPDGFSSTAQNPTISDATPANVGKYYVTITDGNGCTNIDSVDVTVYSSPNVSAGSNSPICEGEDLNLTESGGDAQSWSWNGPNGFSSTNQNPTISNATPSNSGWYYVTVTDGNGCTNIDSVDVTVNSTPSVNAGSNSPVCEGSDINLTESGGDATGWSWSGPDGFSSTAQNPTISDATPVNGGKYYVTITDANGCTNIDSVNVNVNPTPSVDAGSNSPVCEGSDINLTESGGDAASWSWSGPSGFSSNEQNPTISNATLSNEGKYFVSITDSTGCSNIDSVDVSVSEVPTADAGEDSVSICHDVNTYELTNSNASSYSSLEWATSGDGNFDDNTILHPVYTFGSNDKSNGSVWLYLTAKGNGPCGDAVDSIKINIPPELEITVGRPYPFLISNNTKITVDIVVGVHDYIQDLSYYLVANDSTRIELKKSPNDLFCNFSDSAALTFSTELSDTLEICTGSPLIGSYGITGDWSNIYGEDPSNGAWQIQVVDNQPWSGSDGYIRDAMIQFTDTTNQGDTATVSYKKEGADIPIKDYQGSGPYQKTSYTVPMTLEVSCNDECDATAIASITGGTPPYNTIEWSDDANFNNIISASDTTDLCAGTFYVRVIDDLGCVALDSVTVTQPPEIIIDSLDVISIDDLNGCHGDSIGEVHDSAYGGTGTLHYELIKDPFSEPDTIETNTSGDFTGLAAGFYALEVFDDNGCLKDTTFEITQPDSIEILYEKHKPLTNPDSTNGEIHIYAEGGTAPLTYTLYDSIAEPDSIVETVTPADTAHFTNLPESDYYVVVSDSNDCDSIQSSIFYIGPMQVLLSIDSTVCPAGSDGEIAAEVKGGISPFTYQWTKLPSNDTLRILEDTITSRDTLKNVPSGEYVLNVIDDNDFNLRDTIEIPDKIEIDSITVNPSSYDLDAWASGGNDSLYIYVKGQKSDSILYPDTASYNSTEGSNFAGFNDLDTDTYKIIATDSLCQADTLTIRIPITVEMSIIDSIECYGDANGRIEATVSGSNKNKPYTYEWSNSVTNISNNDKDTISGIQADTYYIKVTDTYGLSAVDSITLPEPPKINITTDTIIPAYCKERQEVLAETDTGAIYIDVEGGRPFNHSDYRYKYLWEEAEDSIGNLDNLTNKSSGSYTVTVSDSNGCKQTKEYYIPHGSDYAIDAEAKIAGSSAISGDSIFVCPSDSIDLQTVSLSNENSAYWQFRGYTPGNDFEDTLRTKVIDGKYTLIAENEKCKAAVPAGITYFHDSPGLNIISFNERNVSDQDSVNVLEKHETVEVSAEANESLGTTYKWKPDYFDPAEGLSTVLNIEAIQEAGKNEAKISVQTETDNISDITDTACIYRDYLEVNIIPDVKPVDAFSPNGDGNNDEWLIKYGNEYEDLEVIIFNRWGGKVFSKKGNFDISQDYGNHIKVWDGKTKGGRDLPTGTYYYIIDPHVTGVQTLKGTVTIIR